MKNTGDHELLMMMEKCGHFLYHRRGGKRGQGKILKILYTQGEMTQKDLQERLGIQSGSMSEIILKLEASGLIERMKDETDRRKIKVKITKEGEKFFEDNLKKNVEEENKLFNALSEEQKIQLEGLLAQLFADWEANFDKSFFEHGKGCEGEENKRKRRRRL